MEILILFGLIVLNGVFAMSEMAVVSSRKPRLQQWAEEKRRGASAALALSNEPSNFLSTIQIGITVIGITSGAFGEATVAAELTEWLTQWPSLAPHASLLGTAIVVTAITFASLIIGELVPKRLALLSPEAISSVMAKPMSWLTFATYPLVRMLSATSAAVLRLLRIKPSDEPPVTEDEIRVLMDHGTRAGVFQAHERALVTRAFRLDALSVEAIMTPRGEIVYLDLAAQLDENLQKIATSDHSRFPVCRGGLENVLGFVFAKHLLRDTTRGQTVDIQAHVVPALYVPETITVMNLIELMKARRETSALIVDEFGDIQGLATMHDVMEALVGDIANVDTESEADAVQRDDGSWLMDAGMSVQRFKDVLDIRETLPAEEDETYHTLAGFVITRLGRIPRTGDVAEWDSYRFEVVDMDNNRVDKVLVSVAVAQEPADVSGAPGSRS